MHKKRKKLLILVKEDNDYGVYTNFKSGLFNSARFLAKALRHEDIIKDYQIEVCIDGNSVDRFVYDYRPDVCIIEALWVTPEKLREVQRLHPKVIFYVRIHSNIPFLANEGIAMGWMKRYENIKNCYVALNSLETKQYLKRILKRPVYMPNVYQINEAENWKNIHWDGYERQVHIGCFGAIRPLKNQLIQAVAAINLANRYGLLLNFHINGSRVEMNGESIRKNLRSLFYDSPHQLIEHGWMRHSEFLDTISKMDLGLQVSFTESFNIVTADFVRVGVPIIVSHDIAWMNDSAKVSTTDASEIESKIKRVLTHPKFFVKRSRKALANYNSLSLESWKTELNS